MSNNCKNLFFWIHEVAQYVKKKNTALSIQCYMELFPVHFTFHCFGVITKFKQCLIMISDFLVHVTLQSLGSLSSRLSCQWWSSFLCVFVCMPFSFPIQRVVLQIAFVWSISLAICSPSERAATDWAEMRHGFIRPPLHFTSIPFAPYYSHLTVSARACRCVCVPCVIMFYFERTRTREKKKRM